MGIGSPVETALLGAAALGVLALLYRALRSPLRPFSLPLDAWRAALASVRATPGPAALAALVIGLGAALQEFFTYGPRIEGPALTLASLAWQALVAVAMAMIAVPVHRHVIDREPRGFLVEAPAVAPTGIRPLLPRAAALGGAIWLATYLVEVAGRLAAITVPEDAAVLTYRGAQLAGFVAAALLSLVRPALSSGLRAPVRAGLRVALAHLPTLLTVHALLLIPPLLFGIVGIELVRIYLGLSLGVHVLNDVSIVAFSTLQFLAVEAATVLFLRTAVLVPAPEAYQGATYAQARSH